MRKGFTLIELLVVIAIIAILAAILFPVFERAKNKAQQATCISNEKQIGTALLMYIHDWDYTTPLTATCPGTTCNTQSTPPCVPAVTPASWGGWDGYLWPYTQNEEMYFCPAQPNITQGWGASTLGGFMLYGYGCNAINSGVTAAKIAQQWWNKPVDYVQYPSHMIVFLETSTYAYHIENRKGTFVGVGDGGYPGGLTQVWGPTTGAPNHWLGFGANAGSRIVPFHANIINCLFMDGHVQAIDIGTLWDFTATWPQAYYFDASTGTKVSPGGQWGP